ncbi:MAG: tyrosine-protein phosphatase [Rhodospirillales bacterium]|nr:tyrosine-protein phosphatase [Rhodospirillales bacterium]
MIDLPVAAPPAPPLSRFERLRAHLDSFFVDHGIFRQVYRNRHRVSNVLWRSAQPSPSHLRREKALGTRTIVNLRGRRDTCGSYILERRACEELGLALVDFPIRSRSALDRSTLHAAADMFERIEYPALIHCKSGADRAGLMATLYLFVAEGVPLPEAMKTQLSIRYGHVKSAKTGVIDHFFERFLSETGGALAEFYPWVDSRYDPVALTAEHRSGLLANFLVNKVLRRE